MYQASKLSQYDVFQMTFLWLQIFLNGWLQNVLRICLLATEENQSQLLAFVFSKQYLLCCPVHYLWFGTTFGYFQN